MERQVKLDLEGMEVVKCLKCKGSGISPHNPENKCWTCHGGGYVVIKAPERMCMACKGTGTLYGHTCSHCHGCGYQEREYVYTAVDKNGVAV